MPNRDLLRRSALWRRTRRLTMALLAVWFGVTFAAIFFARELAGLTLFGWSVSFYIAAQGALLAYLAIVGIYALVMKALEARAGNDSHGG
jgi:putative solute:sodium symporter small subunit